MDKLKSLLSRQLKQIPLSEALNTEDEYIILDKVNEKYNKIYLAHEYEVLTVDAVTYDVNDRIDVISSILQLPPPITNVILNHFDWDETAAVSSLMVNRNKVFTDIGVQDPNTTIVKFKRFIKKAKRLVKNNGNQCRRRSVLRHRTTLTSLNCKHKYCTLCWNAYIRKRILTHQESYTITCPSPNCSVLVNYEKVIQNILHVEVAQEYRKLNLIKFIENSELYTWCPSDKCNKIIKVAKGVDEMEIICSCGYKFCFSCFKTCHNPINCEMFKNWLMKLIATDYNFKICPNCDRVMQYFENCNLNSTLCTSCDVFYCAYCSGPNEINQNLYSANANHFCVEEDHKVENNPLYRYQHYLKKYNKHKDILDAKTNLDVYIETQLNLDISNFDNWSVVNLVKRIVNSVFQCRKTLMYSYIFSYYLKNNNYQANIFLHNQNSLETAVEDACKRLEKIYDNNYSDNTLKSMERQVAYCCNLEKMLHVAINDGYEDNTWEFME